MPRIVKIHSCWYSEREGRFLPDCLDYQGCRFITDPELREYDWLVVYDEMHRKYPTEQLACAPSHTILVTQEPQSIKIYNPTYTTQFEYVLTTCDPFHCPHRNHRYGRGCYVWFNGHRISEHLKEPEYPKTKLISTICSTKRMGHTAHAKRYELVDYLSTHIPDFDWFGLGRKEIEHKYEALDAYRYSVAMENHIQPHHMSEKLPDCWLSLCLPFYAGDPTVTEVFPEGSVIPIPLDNPPEAAAIIRKAIADNEYEKRLPAIREARRLILQKYNLMAQVAELIREHETRYRSCPEPDSGVRCIVNRKVLRRRPLNALRCLYYWARQYLYDHFVASQP
ncbi:MAG: glycosyltransferase [Akkermansia sp.]